MATRQHRLADFPSKAERPEGQLFELLCEDKSGTLPARNLKQLMPKLEHIRCELLAIRSTGECFRQLADEDVDNTQIAGAFGLCVAMMCFLSAADYIKDACSRMYVK